MAARNSDAKTVGYLQLVRQNKAFRYLWMGQIVSLLGDWFNLIASASLIAVLTQSGTAVGGLFVVRVLAPFLISPIAGVAADRYNRKTLLILTDVLRGLTVLGFLFVRRPEDVWLVYALTAIQMGLSGFFFPARNAILPNITSKEELGTANALSASTWSVMLAFGAALGGLTSGLLGPYPAFVLDALTFFLSAAIIFRMPYQQSDDNLDTSEKTIMAGLRQYVDGLRYIVSEHDVFAISLIKPAISLFIAGGFQVVQVTIAEQVFVIGEGGGITMGLMYAVIGVGTGIGPIAARYFTGDRDRPIRIAIVISFAISGIGLLITSSLTTLPLVLFGTFLRGIGAGTAWVFSTQLMLMAVTDDVRGRVFSSEFAMFNLSNAIGAGMVGAMLDSSMGLGNIILLMAVTTVAPTVLWAVWVIMGNRAKPAIETA